MQGDMQKFPGDLPRSFNNSVTGSHRFAAEIIARQMIMAGITDFKVVRGHVQFVDEDTNPSSRPNTTTMRQDHVWIEYQGKVIAPTMLQYDSLYGELPHEFVPEITQDGPKYFSGKFPAVTNPEPFFDGRIVPDEVRELLAVPASVLSSATQPDDNDTTDADTPAPGM